MQPKDNNFNPDFDFKIDDNDDMNDWQQNEQQAQGVNYYAMFLQSILDQSKEYPSPVAVINLFQRDEYWYSKT